MGQFTTPTAIYTSPSLHPAVLLQDLEEEALYDVTIVRRSAGRQTMVGPVTIRAQDPPHQVRRTSLDRRECQRCLMHYMPQF